MINESQIAHVTGTTVRDNEGNKIGKAGQVYLDDATGQPAWLTVNTGLFGTSENFVPIEGADLSDDVVTVAFSKDRVKDSPKVDADNHLDAAEEQELYRHYGLPTHDTNVHDLADHDAAADDADRHDADRLAAQEPASRTPQSRDVDTEPAQPGQARLRKYVTAHGQPGVVPVPLDQEADSGRETATATHEARTESMDLDTDATVRSTNR